MPSFKRVQSSLGNDLRSLAREARVPEGALGRAGAAAIVLVAFMLAIPATAPATTWYVHPDSALSSIQSGLNTAAAGDTVLVAPGTYAEGIIWPDRDGIKLLSEFGPEVTTINGGTSRAILMSKYHSGTTVIDGFKTWNGAAVPPDPDGGGIYCDSSSPTIRNNIITSNSAYGNGGGIYGFYCNSVVKGNSITGNSATSGRGGGIYCGDSSHMTISENRIAGNSAGGGIQCMNAEPGIQYNQIIDNNAADGGGGYFGQTSWPPYLEPQVHENSFEGNTAYGAYRQIGCDAWCDENWWGHTAGPDSGDHFYPVDFPAYYTPWLTQRIRFDLGVDAALQPPDTVLADSSYTPAVVVRNQSNLSYSATCFAATCWIGSGYENYVRVNQPLAKDSTFTIQFRDWTVPPQDSTSYLLTAVVHYVIDDVPANDTIRKDIHARKAGVHESASAGPKRIGLALSGSPASSPVLVRYDVPARGYVRLCVRDTQGRLARTLATGERAPGQYEVTLAAQYLAPGVYFADLQVGSLRKSVKVVRVR
jgi:parallel beta-helix repeat protein